MDWRDIVLHPLVLPSVAVLAVAFANGISRTIQAVTGSFKSRQDSRRLEVEMQKTAWAHQINEGLRLADENKTLRRDNADLIRQTTRLLTENGNLKEQRERKAKELLRCTEYTHAVEREMATMHEHNISYKAQQAQMQEQAALLARLTQHLITLAERAR